MSAAGPGQPGAGGVRGAGARGAGAGGAGAALLVQLGDAYQRATDWHLHLPPLAARVT